MKRHRLAVEVLEPRLVLDSGGLGGLWLDAPLEVPAGSAIATAVGVVEVGQETLFVDVLLLVPPGADADQAAADALRGQGARPLQSAEYALTGLTWDQFFDGNNENDFLVQYYNPTNDPTGGGEQALQNSQATWTEVVTSSFVFEYGGTTTRAPSLVRESPGPQYLDGFNDVAWMRLRPGTLGVTWYDTAADEADMVLNTRYRWSTGGNPGANEIDVETVMLHENGHVVGLGHSDDPGSVMQAYYGGVQRTLGQDDVDGITAKYPAEPADPVTDLAVAAVVAPSNVAQGNWVDVQVTVENVGNQDVGDDVTVTLSETPNGFAFTDQVIAGLTVGASRTLTFSWDTADAEVGSHTLAASITFGDQNAANNTESTTVTVSEPVADVTVALIWPAFIPAGTTVENVVITGSGFVDGAQLTFENGSGPAPVASDVVVVDASTIMATITTKSGGRPRDRVWDVRVTNPDGATGVLPGGLTVTVSSPLIRPKLGGRVLRDWAALERIAPSIAAPKTDWAFGSSDDQRGLAQSVDFVLTYLL